MLQAELCAAEIEIAKHAFEIAKPSASCATLKQGQQRREQSFVARCEACTHARESLPSSDIDVRPAVPFGSPLSATKSDAIGICNDASGTAGPSCFEKCCVVTTLAFPPR